MHLLIDSTGIKADGEWHVRKHGSSKRRRRVKLHLAIDPETPEVQAIEVTGAGVMACEVGRQGAELQIRAAYSTTSPRSESSKSSPLENTKITGLRGKSDP